MKNVLWILFFVASVLSSCKKEDLGSVPDGQKEMVQLSFSGQLSPEARNLVLTPKEEGGGIKIETKVSGSTLPVTFHITGSDGSAETFLEELQMAEDGKSFRFSKEVDISRLQRPLKLTLSFRTGSLLEGEDKVYKFDKTQPISSPMIFLSTGNPLVEETDSHGNTSIVARNISVSLAGFIMRLKLVNETGKDYVVKSIRTQYMTPAPNSLQNRTGDLSPTLRWDLVQHQLEGSESGLILRAGETSDEYLMYCALTPAASQYVHGAMSLDVEPTDGVYDQAVFTDIGRISTPAGIVGKIVTKTVKLRELKSPLAYFDSKMVGQTPTVAVTPEVTFTGFQDKAPVNVNIGYYDQTEVNQINVPGYHIPTEYEWQGLLPGFDPTGQSGLPLFPIRLRADRVQYRRYREGGAPVPGGDAMVNKDYFAPAPESGRKYQELTPIQVGDRVFEYGDVSFIRDGVESIPVPPWLEDNRPEFRPVYREIIPPSLPILEDPSKKLVFYGLILGGGYVLDGRFHLAGDPATNNTPHKVVRLLSNSARYAYKYSFYRDRAVIETCPVGGNPSIQTAADVRDQNLFATSSKVERREILYVPGSDGTGGVIGKRNGDFFYSREGAGQEIQYPTYPSGAPVQYTYTAPEYPLIYLNRGVVLRSRGMPYSHRMDWNASMPIGLRDHGGNGFSTNHMPRVRIGGNYYASEIKPKYPVWLIKNAD